MLWNVFIKIILWFLLTNFWFLTCWAWPMNVTLGNICILQVFLTCKDTFLFNLCLMCYQLAIIYECFTYANTLYAYIWSETGHLCICLLLMTNTLLLLVYSWSIYLMHASVRLMSWMNSKFYSYANLEALFLIF